MTEKDKNIKKEKAKNLYKTQESRKTSRKNKSENLNMDQESWKNRERKNRKTFTWTKNQESYRESLLPFKINTGYRSQEKLARGIFLLTNHHIYSTFFTIFCFKSSRCWTNRFGLQCLYFNEMWFFDNYNYRSMECLHSIFDESWIKCHLLQ